MRPQYYLIPPLIFLFFWFIFPFLYDIYMSSMSYGLYSSAPPQFVGAANYIRLFQSADFWMAFGRTMAYVGICLTLELLLGLVLALILSKEGKIISVIRLVIALPILMVPVGISVVWKVMAMPSYGILEYITQLMGHRIAWLGHPIWTNILIIVTEVWQWAAFVFLILLAGIVSLPKEPYEAAKIDRLSDWTVFTKITLPMLKPVIIIVCLIRALDLLKFFDPVYALTRGGVSTETLSYYIYRTGFKTLNMGWGGTVSTVYWVLCWLLANAVVRRFRGVFE